MRCNGGRSKSGTRTSITNRRHTGELSADSAAWLRSVWDCCAVPTSGGSYAVTAPRTRAPLTPLAAPPFTHIHSWPHFIKFALSASLLCGGDTNSFRVVIAFVSEVPFAHSTHLYTHNLSPLRSAAKIPSRVTHRVCSSPVPCSPHHPLTFIQDCTLIVLKEIDLQSDFRTPAESEK